MSEFFGQLTEFSRRVCEAWKLPAVCSWAKGLSPAGFRGAVIHYTEGQRLRGSVAWFMDESFKAGVSAHVVVAQQKIEVLEAFAHDLPMVQALPVTVVQCVPRTMAAYHAPGYNSTFYGIENVNAGWLTKNREGVYRYGPNNRNQYQKEREPVASCGRWWDPYTLGQVEANIIILRELKKVSGIRPPWLVGHEQVQSTRTQGSSHKDKRDPGPVYPFAAVREGVWKKPEAPLSDLQELVYWAADPDWATSWRDGVLMSRVGAGYPEQAWAYFYRDLGLWLEQAGSRGPVEAVLELLGYDVSEGCNAALWMFRRMEHLPGPEEVLTYGMKVALLERLEDRGLIDSNKAKLPTPI